MGRGLWVLVGLAVSLSLSEARAATETTPAPLDIVDIRETACYTCSKSCFTDECAKCTSAIESSPTQGCSSSAFVLGNCSACSCCVRTTTNTTNHTSSTSYCVPSTLLTLSKDTIERCYPIVTKARFDSAQDNSCFWIRRSFATRDWGGVCSSECFGRYLSAYGKILEAGCGIYVSHPTPDQVEDAVCQLEANQNQVLHTEKYTFTRGLMLLPVKTLTASQFKSGYSTYLRVALSKITTVPRQSVEILQVYQRPQAVEVEFSVLDTMLGETDAGLSALELSLRQNFGDTFNKLGANIFLSGEIGVSKLATVRVDPCQSVSTLVRTNCRDGCSGWNAKRCCIALAGRTNLRCPQVHVCGASLSSFGSSCQCSKSQFSGTRSISIQDELFEIYDFYTKRAPSLIVNHPPTPKKSSNQGSNEDTNEDTNDAKASLGGSGTPYTAPTFGIDIWEQYTETDNTDLSYSVFKNCPDQCSGLGIDCVNKKCVCRIGYGGSNCKQFIGCTNLANCSGLGVCHCSADVCSCTCANGYSGDDCSIADFECPSQCSLHGSCQIGGSCNCDDGWNGTSCAEPIIKECLYNCSGHGSCDPATGRCTCDTGFFGDDCDYLDRTHVEERCSGCSGHGDCNFETGRCTCSPGFYGRTCQYTHHRHNCTERAHCSGHGTCNSTSGNCMCSPGYAGWVCNHVVGCKNHCSGHGKCKGTPPNEFCVCKRAWDGDDCSRPRCSTDSAGNLCSNHGICEKKQGVYQCTCDPGYIGSTCEDHAEDSSDPVETESLLSSSALASVELAPVPESKPVPCGGNNCSEQGICTVEGDCDCFVGRTGVDCSIEIGAQNEKLV